MEIAKDFFISLLISIPITLAGVLYDDWISKRGYSRSYRSVVAFCGVFGCLLKPYLAPSISWWIYSLIVLLSITLGIHQFDRRETWYKGPFWWKREESIKKYKRKKNIENNNSLQKDKIRLSTKQKNYIKFLREKSQKEQRAKYND